MSELLTSLKANWEMAHGGALSRAPLYHQLYSVLREAIMDGTIPYKAQMPTEQQLSETFDLSRITAKRAMDELAAEGLVARFRGKGSHVTYQYTPEPVRAPLVGMLENLVEMGKRSKVRVISVEKVAPPADIRELLGLEEGDTAHKLVRVRSDRDGELFAYYVSWTTGIRKGFTKRMLETTPRLDVIRDNGIVISKVEQVLSAENASVKIAGYLDTDPGAALLSIRRLSSDADGCVVDVLDGLYNPTRFQYAMVLSVDS
jgi:GntR family transcriptional regulator